MSGIAGILNLDGRPVESGNLDRMLDSMTHRGPDGSGRWSDGRVGLANLALWTCPHSCLESLPMKTSSGVVITGDVRLDNREDLLSSLSSKAKTLSVETPDCALVAAAYRTWGENCVDHLRGDFAFAIWDIRSRSLFCARDHMGVKPFYYAFRPGQHFVFASEAKAILSLPEIEPTLNEQKIADSFVHLINDPVSTYYRNVHRLPAAHCLSLVTTISTRRYWRLNPDYELRLKSDRDCAEGFFERFSRAVRTRMDVNCPIGAMLSGGLDSSSIACVGRDWLRQQGKAELCTFSAVFDEVPECDERPFIETVLKQGHCKPNPIVLDSLSPLTDANEVTWHLDEPISAGNLYLNWTAYRKAQELGVRVMLDGFDGDTTVSHGSGLLTELASSGKWWQLARELQGGTRNFGGNHWLDCWCSWVSKYHPVARQVSRIWSGTARRIKKPSPRPATAGPLALLNPALVRRANLEEFRRKPAPPFVSERYRHFLLIEREVMARNLELLAHTSAAFGVEPRFPFMDVQLIEYCLSLPSDQKMRNGYTRFVMRSGLEGVLPEKIQWRGGKSNLGPSFERGLLKFEGENLDTIIHSQAQQLSEYVDLQQVDLCLSRFRAQTAIEDEISILWTTATLALWLRGQQPRSKPFILQRKEVN